MHVTCFLLDIPEARSAVNSLSNPIKVLQHSGCCEGVVCRWQIYVLNERFTGGHMAHCFTPFSYQKQLSVQSHLIH